MNWNIPQISGQSLQITLEVGEKLFIVGANGSGKSALVQQLVTSEQQEEVRRISSYRQTFLMSRDVKRMSLNQNQFDRNMQYQADLSHDYVKTRESAVLPFDLVAKENSRARLISDHVDNGNIKKAKKIAAESPSPFEELNELLKIGTLEVTLESSNGEEVLARHRNGSEPFDISRMSDGERNAVIIAATVLTVVPGTVLVIDEPERHLHRSIIEPFLSAVFERRTDCAFVVSTHEIALPVAYQDARVLMVRSCKWDKWSSEIAAAWDVEVLEANVTLPEDLKRAILGSRKRILFVEGYCNSLDLPLYSALFPDILVVPKGSCSNVLRAVSGIRGSEELHHVEAFGLIDRDGRDEKEVKQLAEDGVFALDMYSVESLYYCSDAIDAVARRQAESLGSNADAMIKSATEKALDVLNEDGLAERMAARRCERRVRDAILQRIPDWQCIKAESKFDISVDSPYQDELSRFNELVNEKRLDDLVARYPLRASRAFDAIAETLELNSRKTYEQMLVSRVWDDEDLAQSLKQRIGPLSGVLIAEFTASENAKA